MTNISRESLPPRLKTQQGGSARVPSCHEEVWEWSWSAVTPHLTDVLSGSMLRVGRGSRGCQSQIQWRMKTECVLTRTLPVSVWAEIMTPAQSLTEVIQPTSLAAGSSLSVRLMPSPVVIRWTSWKKRGNHEKPGAWQEVNTKWLVTQPSTVIAMYRNTARVKDYRTMRNKSAFLRKRTVKMTNYIWEHWVPVRYSTGKQNWSYMIL